MKTTGKVNQPHWRSAGTGPNLNIDDPEFDITMAFQPIVDMRNRQILGYEALLRGSNGELPRDILPHLCTEDRYHFDLMCRDRAIQLATLLKNPGLLCINFMPNAIFDPRASLLATLNTAEHYGWPADQIIFEFTEEEPIHDTAHMHRIIQNFGASGFGTAIDDFGAGYAGLNLLADFQPHIVKLDMLLIRGIDSDIRRQAILVGILEVCRRLCIEVIAEGVETRSEFEYLHTEGISLFQGHYFARPETAHLPTVDFQKLLVPQIADNSEHHAIGDLMRMAGKSEQQKCTSRSTS